MRLNIRRFINLVYFVFREGVAHDKKKLRDFERTLERAPTADGTPGWFKDDRDAAESSLAAARALGVKV